jgi:hypothetical protein
MYYSWLVRLSKASEDISEFPIAKDSLEIYPGISGCIERFRANSSLGVSFNSRSIVRP